MMGGSNMMGGSWGSSSGGGLEGILSTIISLALVAGIILLVFWLIRQYSASGNFRANTLATGGVSALDILKNRYAHGEIDRDEYEEKISVLTGAG